MLPAVKVFSKDAPCTKADLWVCFRREEGFVRVPVAEAHSIIGLNAPRGMEQRKRLVRVEHRGTQYYQLTPAGETWLNVGIISYLKNHPLHTTKLHWLPSPTGRLSARRLPEIQSLPTGSLRLRRVRA